MKLSKLWSMSILIVLALLLSAANGNSGNAVSPTAPNQKRSETREQVQRTPNATLSPATPTPSALATITKPQGDTRRVQSRHWYDRFWPPLFKTFFPPVWSNWALAVVGIVAAWAALRTLNEIARQSRIALTNARAAMRTANAAKKSADAANQALHANRPVLIVYRIDVGTQDWTGDKPKIDASIHLKNIGNGRALITNARSGLTVEKVTPWDFEQPERPLRFPAWVEDRVISPETIGTIRAGNSLQLSDAEGQSVKEIKWTIVFAGSIQYRDPALDREYALEFCWLYKPPADGHKAGRFEIGPPDLQRF